MGGAWGRDLLGVLAHGRNFTSARQERRLGQNGQARLVLTQHITQLPLNLLPPPPDFVIEAFRQPAIKQPYVMRSLAMPMYDVTKFQKSDELVNRSFWWEVLCVVTSRPPYITDKTIEIIDHPSVKVRTNLLTWHFSFISCSLLLR